MPPTFLASCGWERPTAWRRSRTRSPTDLAAACAFMGVVYKKNWWLHKISCNLGCIQAFLLTSCKCSCLVLAMAAGTTRMTKVAIGIAALRQAIRHNLKSQVAVARAVGVSPQAGSDALRRCKRVPAEWCLALEIATAGAITRHDLRPDLYPEAAHE